MMKTAFTHWNGLIILPEGKFVNGERQIGEEKVQSVSEVTGGNVGAGR
jgi:hypothetical protein